MSFNRNPQFEWIDRRRSNEAVRETRENMSRGSLDPPDYDIDPPELIGEALLSCLLFAGPRMLDRTGDCGEKGRYKGPC
jgi:hypothetical protein